MTLLAARNTLVWLHTAGLELHVPDGALPVRLIFQGRMRSTRGGTCKRMYRQSAAPASCRILSPQVLRMPFYSPPFIRSVSTRRAPGSRPRAEAAL